MLQFIPFNIPTVREAMTGLYADKANNHVPWDDMYGFSLLKIAGKPYEDALRDSRTRMDKLAKQVTQ